MRFVIPFGPIVGDAHAERYRTLFQIEIVEFAGEMRLTEFLFRARFDDEADHNATIWIARGVGGTAHSELPAETIPKPDVNQGDATFRMRHGFLVEPFSEPGDVLKPQSLPSAKVIGPIRWRPADAIVVRPPYGLRIMAASKEDLRGTFSGHIEVDAR